MEAVERRRARAAAGADGAVITNARTLGADSAKLLSLSLDYTRQGEALEDGRTQDVCNAAALYLKQAGEALGAESASLRRHYLEEEPLLVAGESE